MIFKKRNFLKLLKKDLLAISDKYWITSVIPPKGKEFKTTFDYKNKFRANYISTQGMRLDQIAL